MKRPETIDLPAIGEHLAVARQELQFTRGELARRLEVALPDLARAERGENSDPMALIVRLLLLHFPGINANWLLVGHGEMLAEAGDAAHGIAELDVPAVLTAARLFWGAVESCDAKRLLRLATDAPHFLAWVYRVYLSHLRSFRASGQPEDDARAAAELACERMAEREAEAARDVLAQGAVRDGAR